MDDPGISRKSRQEIPTLRHGPSYRNILGTTRFPPLLPPFIAEACRDNTWLHRDANPLNACPSNQVAGADSNGWAEDEVNRIEPLIWSSRQQSIRTLSHQLIWTHSYFNCCLRAARPLQFLRRTRNESIGNRRKASRERLGGYYRILTSHSSDQHSI